MGLSERKEQDTYILEKGGKGIDHNKNRGKSFHS